MTVPVGGLRARLIRESLYQMIYDAIDDRGWFSTLRKHSPISFTSDPVPLTSIIAPNTAALADADVNEDETELGSNQAEQRWVMYVDFFGENEAVSIDFSRDVKDIISGRMASVGRTGPTLDVYDYTMATPEVIFVCQLENVFLDRPEIFTRPYLAHWRTVRFDVVDVYTGEDG